MAEKPEPLALPEIFCYEEARNTNNNRIIEILVHWSIGERAIELLALQKDEKSFILDVAAVRDFSEVYWKITFGLALTIAVIREIEVFE